MIFKAISLKDKYKLTANIDKAPIDTQKILMTWENLHIDVQCRSPTLFTSVNNDLCKMLKKQKLY